VARRSRRHPPHPRPPRRRQGIHCARAVSAASDPDPWFEVSLIPETLAATTLGTRAVGDPVNLETDILARHVQRMLAFAGDSAPTERGAL
jgi:riboflavin synthase